MPFEGVAGFVEAPRFYPYLTGRKNLELLAALDGDGAATRIDEVLEIVELSPRAGHRVGGYSHGMRQRLGIAAALLRAPRLLILDEPATGLDPAGMRDMRRLIRRLADEGITVLLSSHQLPEVQELCDRVAIVDSGRVVYEGALRDLRRQGGAGYRLRTTDDARALELARAQAGVEHAGSGEHGVYFQAEERVVGELSLALARAGIGILALTPELATLEDLFFRLTEGGGANGAAASGSGGGPAGATSDRPGASGAPAAARGPSRSDEQRGHQHAGGSRARGHARASPLDADRLPLGAAQADLPEAHLPRPGARHHPAAVLRRLPERAPRATITAQTTSSPRRSPSPDWPRRC